MPLGIEEERNEMPEGQTKGSSLKQVAAIDDELRCPLCGGKARRRWSSICQINLIIFLFFAMLAFRFLHIGFGVKLILFLICSVITILSLFTLPITGAMAVASRPRCRICGHRFWPAPGASNSINNIRFPVRYAVFGNSILVVALGIGMALVILVPGWETWTVILTIGGRSIMAGLAFGFALLAQAILWRRLHTQTAVSAHSRFVLLLPAIIFSTGWLALTVHDHFDLVGKFHPLVRAPKVLARAQLANLPESACKVHVYRMRAMFVGEDYLRFKAKPEDIERFLTDSPSLKGLMCHKYSKERMRLAYHDHDSIFKYSRTDGHEYFFPDRGAPSWYKEEIRDLGRRYEVNLEANNWFGDVIVDDEQHVIYIHFCRH